VTTGDTPDLAVVTPADPVAAQPVRVIDPVVSPPAADVPATDVPDVDVSDVDVSDVDVPDVDVPDVDGSHGAAATGADLAGDQPAPHADAGSGAEASAAPAETSGSATVMGDSAPNPVPEHAPAAPTFPRTGADTATADSFGFTFNLARIEGQGEDADPLLHRARDLGLVGVFDGMGGAGGRVYETADGPRTGAYLASRIVSDVVHRHLAETFAAGGDVDGDAVAGALHAAVETALVQALDGLHAAPSGLRSRLIRALPTTMAVAVVQRREEDGQEWVCHLFWAGDSRVYVVDPARGAAQLTADDIRDAADAMANLRADSVLSNAISADTPFVVHHRRLSLTVPFVLVAATDGAFGYLPSPMHFEHLLLATLRTTGGIEDWSATLQRQIAAVTGDDAALAVLGVGAGHQVWRDLVAGRVHHLENDFVRPLDGVAGDLRRMELEVEILRNRSAELSAELWSQYRTGYERYRPEPAGEERT
jgi:serine/threonine protein phosphatase PrpC